MTLHGVRPVLAVAVFAAAALAACGGGGGGAVPGGGGGGGGPTPTPVPTAPPGPNFVKGVSGVAQIPANASNTFSSSMLGASTDGTFVIQSSDTPGTPSGNTPTLTEYTITATESAAGVTSSTSKARIASAAGREGSNAALPFRPRLDPRTPSLLTLHKRMALTVAHSGRSVQSVRRISSFTLNDPRTFHVQQGTITGVGATCTGPGQIPAGTSCYIDRPAHLKSISAHAYVWVDDGIDPSYGFTQADWDATSATFDADYARETVAFAPAFNAGLAPYTGNNTGGGNTYEQCDTSKSNLSPTGAAPPYQTTPDLSGADPHISILVTNALENTGEGGYFDFSNDLNDQELNCSAYPHVPSNTLPMFVIGADKYGPNGTGANEPYWRTQDMPRSVPHEFQHYLHALNKVLVPDLVNACNSSTGCGVFDDSFVDEGESMLAEDLVLGTGANPPQSPDSQLLGFEYLYTPGNYSLTAFAGYDVDPLYTGTGSKPYGFYRYTAGNYGGAYLFARYLYDRFGGDAGLHRVYATITRGTGTSANVAPIVAEANGEPFAQVYGEFAEALAARNVASGGDARFQFSSNVLLRGVTTYTTPSGAVWNERFNGPRSPQDLTSSTPGTSGRIKLTPTNTVSIKLISGATVFPNVAAAAGSVVSGSVAGAPSLGVNAALVQGAYDDSSACFGPPTGSSPCT